MVEGKKVCEREEFKYSSYQVMRKSGYQTMNGGAAPYTRALATPTTGRAAAATVAGEGEEERMSGGRAEVAGREQFLFRISPETHLQARTSATIQSKTCGPTHTRFPASYRHSIHGLSNSLLRPPFLWFCGRSYPLRGQSSGGQPPRRRGGRGAMKR